MTSRDELSDCANVTRGSQAGVASAMAEAVVRAMKNGATAAVFVARVRVRCVFGHSVSCSQLSATEMPETRPPGRTRPGSSSARVDPAEVGDERRLVVGRHLAAEHAGRCGSPLRRGRRARREPGDIHAAPVMLLLARLKAKFQRGNGNPPQYSICGYPFGATQPNGPWPIPLM